MAKKKGRDRDVGSARPKQLRKRLRKAEDQLQDAQTKRDRAQARVEALSIIADEIRAQLAEINPADKDAMPESAKPESTGEAGAEARRNDSESRTPPAGSKAAPKPTAKPALKPTAKPKPKPKPAAKPKSTATSAPASTAKSKPKPKPAAKPKSTATSAPKPKPAAKPKSTATSAPKPTPAARPTAAAKP